MNKLCKMFLPNWTKSLLITITIFAGVSFAQNTVNFNTVGAQNWTVPNCVSNITVTVAGAEGGGVAGGNGAVVTYTMNVTPGQVLEIFVGQQGGCPAAGVGGGGSGQPSSIGLTSCAGGGYSAVSLAPGGLMNAVVVAGGGGGTGGGDQNGMGGNGGCPSGTAGETTFGYGGGGATATAGGSGGNPWTSGGGSGGSGSFGQGGAGGIDIGYGINPGGGGGGGYYGGGGGGSDNISLTSLAGGGGGGGGSSLVPAGATCNAGVNTGNGYVTINFTGGLSALANNSGPYCSGQTIQLTVSGGTNYAWTGPNGFTSNLQNPTIPNCTTADAGTYTVTVTDPACPDIVTASTTVTVYQSPTIDAISDITVCNTDVVTIPAFTGNDPATTYSWSNTNTAIGLGPSGNGNIVAFYGSAINNDQVGTITVTPTNGICVGPPEVFTVTVFRDPSVTVSNDTTICENGIATLVATGAGAGGGPYTYHWDFTGDTQGTQVVNPLINSSYSVYVESLNGCTSATETINVSMHPPLSGSISPFDTICPGYPTDVWANVSGGIGAPYTFVWSSGETQSGANTSHQFSVNPPSTQDYIVTITDGCETTPLLMSTNVYVAPLPVPQYEVLDPEQCEPAVFHVVNTTDPALSQYVYWLVDGEYAYVNQDTIETPEFYEGSYDIQMIVTSYLGCIDSTTFVGALDVKPKPVASFQHSPNPVRMFNTQVIFTSTSFLANEYEWYFESAYPSTSSESTTITTFPDGVVGTYNVSLIVTSELGCKDTVDYELIVLPEVVIYAPNAFTPDNDEFNQGWRVFMEGIDVYDFELLIFNRWGEVVWESHDLEIPWDGTYNGEKLPTGTYVWTITTKDLINDAKYTYNGHVSIIK